MKSSLLNIVFLFGAFQALLLIIGVNIRKPFRSSKKKATSLLLFIFFLVMIYYVSAISEWTTFYKYTWMFGSSSWMAIAPAYFIFLKALVDYDFKFKKLHILYFFVSLIFFLDGIWTSYYPNLGMFSSIATAEKYLDVWMLIFFISTSAFLFPSYRLLQNHKEHELHKQLMIFTKAIIGVIGIYAFIYLVIRKNYSLNFELSLIVLFMILIFALVFRAFRLAPIHSFYGEPKYQNLSQNKEADFGNLHNALKSSLNEKQLYLDPKLNLTQLSSAIGIRENQLSQYFNIGLNSSFYEYINELRLTHVEQLIRNGKYKELTITGLAFESGFNSKTTFYKVFKEKHNLTPSQYIKQASRLI